MVLATMAAASAILRTVIHYHIDNNNLDSARFYAERLQAHEPRSNESAYLVALCHSRLGDYVSTYNATKLAGMRGTHLGCSYLFAQACLSLEHFKEGISALEKAKVLWSGKSCLGQHTATTRVAWPDAASVLCLLGKLNRAFKDQKKAIVCFEESLKANPFMWESLTSLCEMSQDVRVNNVYRCTEALFHCFTPEHAAVTLPDGTQLSMSENPPRRMPVRNGPSSVHHDEVSSAQRQSNKQNVHANHAAMQEPRVSTKTATVASGNIEGDGLETPPATRCVRFDTMLLQGPQNGEAPPAPIRRTRTAHASESGILDAPPRISYRVGTKRTQRTQVHEDSGDAASQPAAKTAMSILPADRKRTVSGQPRTTEEQGAPQRRSARLNMFKSTSLKSASGPPGVGGTATRELKKARVPITRMMRPGSSSSNVGRVVSGNRKPIDDALVEPDPPPEPQKQQQQRDNPVVAQAAKQVELEYIKIEEGLKWVLDLMRKITNGFIKLSRYDAAEAIKSYNLLPPGQRESPWVLAQVGRAYYEKTDYVKAETYFRKLRHVAPARMEDMEVYSTVLWFLKKEVDLSYLSHELIDTAWDSPQAWCALGNAMSLARDHEGALKSFKRATQLDPKFAYAYTLQGHEHVANEEYDRALACYRNALSADTRHYNAWYGLGRVYEKLGSYDKAFMHFQTASKLNPSNAVLVLCVGSILEKQKQLLPALQYYHKAVELSPQAAQARYKMSRTLLAIGHLAEARDQLLILKDLAPDEATVHFLLGKLFKTLSENSLAIRHFTIALNLDPRASAKIKEAIESLEVDDGYDESIG